MDKSPGTSSKPCLPTPRRISALFFAFMITSPSSCAALVVCEYKVPRWVTWSILPLCFLGSPKLPLLSILSEIPGTFVLPSYIISSPLTTGFAAPLIAPIISTFSPFNKTEPAFIAVVPFLILVVFLLPVATILP